MKLGIGGDKAYPHIRIPKDWELFVTMTAAEKEAIKEAEQASIDSNELFAQRNLDQIEYVHNINEDVKRHRCPKIAKSRSVVERVIGAMKDYRLLTSVSFISKESGKHVYMLVVVVAALCNYNLEKRGTGW